MTDIYPLVMKPSFRSGQSTPWGGQALKKKFGKEAPEGITGESLEISALPGYESRVINGQCKGKSLSEVFELWGEKLTGKKGDRFPLMLKLLDAQQCLSVQVHPDDSYAMQNEGKAGKSEAWYILDAEPGARLVYGIDTNGENLQDIVKSGQLEKHLHWVEAHPGDVFYIPSGTVHALGSGIQCYEIQQSSDVTYRFWDWNRTGNDGRPRKLHLKQALEVSTPDRIPEAAGGKKTVRKGGEAELLVSDPHFQLYALELNGTFPLPESRMMFVTPSAECRINWSGSSWNLAPFQSVLVPAGLCGAEISGGGRVLISCA